MGTATCMQQQQVASLIKKLFFVVFCSAIIKIFLTGGTEWKHIVDFQTEWEKAKRGQPSALFAADMLYGVRQPRRKHTSVRTQPNTPHVRTRPVPTAPVWPEYQGHSAHRTQGYSPILMEQKSAHAQAVFAQADYVLSKLRSKW
jgi:hypothetical protein